MHDLPSRETILKLRRKYPTGARVELISMNDPYIYLPPGSKGTVDLVDDYGTCHITWDNVARLGALYKVDQIRVLPKDETKS